MTELPAATNFIIEAIAEDLRSGRFDYVRTRFPPEPNGYLHIGHAKALIVDFGSAEKFGGTCNLRYDDTNPIKEDVEFVESMKEDIRWLGFDWGDREFYASDYFDQLYEWAKNLIRDGKAYVDDLSPEQMREYRGTLTEPGVDSPHRNRSVEENLDLFERMRAGEFEEGSRVLRARIDMASGNINMRDPVMYRILKTHHQRTGDKWCIYPMYDYAHGQSDSIEGVTHSFCDLAYEAHRPLYDWFIEQLGIFHPRQIEFSRLNITYTILSKRFLKQLVDQKTVRGWSDPRMPTLSGLRRRGYPAAAIRDFIERVGVAKNEGVADIALLEHCVREDLNRSALRVMGVLDPLKVVITNYPAGQVEMLEAINNPEDTAAGSRQVPFSGTLYIEREDFNETPPPKYFRLAPGKEVRLRYGYFITCTDVIKNDADEVVELRCTYDPDTRGGYAPDGRKVQGTLHWVSADHALDAEVRLYDYLFSTPEPGNLAEGETFFDHLSPNSETILSGCKVEPCLADAPAGTRYQFERVGDLCVDPDTRPGVLVLNRTVGLRDTWAKIAKK